MNDTLTLTLDSIVDLSHLSIQPEDDEYIIGDSNLNIFIRIPSEGVQIISLLKGKTTIKEAQQEIQQKYNIEIDVLDFVNTLLELNLVHKVDGSVLVNYTNKDLGWKKRLGETLFSRYTIILYSVIAITTIFAIPFNFDLIPRYSDAFILDSVGKSMLLFFITSWVLTLFHEVGHYFAAAKENVPVRFRLSIRWFWVVIEADMNGLWAKPPKSRYIPFLAGLLWDIVLLFITIIIQISTSETDFIYAFARMISLIQVYKIIWQFIVFLRTDLYFILITLSNSSNLTDNSLAYILKPFIQSKKEFFELLTNKEKSKAKRYGAFYFIGLLTAILLYCIYSVPAAILAINMAINQIGAYNISSVIFWDGFILLLIFAFEFTLWIFGAWQRYKRRGENNVELQGS